MEEDLNRGVEILSLLDGDGFHFFERRESLQALLNAVLHERGHTVFDGGPDHLFSLGPGLYEPLQLLGA